MLLKPLLGPSFALATGLDSRPTHTSSGSVKDAREPVCGQQGAPEGCLPSVASDAQKQLSLFMGILSRACHRDQREGTCRDGSAFEVDVRDGCPDAGAQRVRMRCPEKAAPRASSSPGTTACPAARAEGPGSWCGDSAPLWPAPALSVHPRALPGEGKRVKAEEALPPG